MSDNDWIKALGAFVVALVGAIGLMAERLWKAKRQNSTAYDLSAVKRERAFREEVFKLMDRKDKDYDDLKADFIKLSKDHLECVKQWSAVTARLEFAEEQLAKLTNWQTLIKVARGAEPESLGETKKG